MYSCMKNKRFEGKLGCLCEEGIKLMNYAPLGTFRGNIKLIKLAVLEKPNNVYSSFNL